MIKRRVLVVLVSLTSVIGVAATTLVANQPAGIPVALKTRHG